MVFIGLIAQIILILLIAHAASERPNSTSGQRWGIGIAVVVLTKAVGFGLSFAVLAALSTVGVTVDESTIGGISVLVDIPLTIIVVIAGYVIAKAAYDRICGPKAADMATTGVLPAE